jgi:hypothetical protein
MGMPFFKPSPFLKSVNEEVHRNGDFHKVKFPSLSTKGKGDSLRMRMASR